MALPIPDSLDQQIEKLNQHADAKVFVEIAGEKAVKAVLATPASSVEHPLASLLRSVCGGSFGRIDRHSETVLRNTVTALRDAFRPSAKSTRFGLNAMLNRVLQTDPSCWDDAAGALGEVRTLGTLVATDLYPAPLKTSSSFGVTTPDFEINRAGWQKPGEMTVEVTTRRMNAVEKQKLSEFHESLKPTEPKQAVTVRECWVAPFGSASRGENGYLNVAHKVASSKSGSLQARDKVPHVLWMDFQDNEASVLSEHFLLPYWSGPGCVAFSTGPVWQGLYGLKGDPVLELHLLGGTTPVTQSFSGKFAQDEKVSIVVCALPTMMAVFENHAAKTPVPERFLFNLMCCPCFSLPHSFVRWPNGLNDFQQRVLAARKTIQAIADFQLG